MRSLRYKVRCGAQHPTEAPRVQTNNSASIPHKPQARQQPHRHPAPNVHPSQASHIRSGARLCSRERSLDERHRLATFSRRRSVARYAALAGGSVEPTDCPCARVPTTFNDHARISVRDRAGAGSPGRASSATRRAARTLPLAFFSSYKDAGERRGPCAHAGAGVAAVGVSACAGAAARWRAPHGRTVLPL